MRAKKSSLKMRSSVNTPLMELRAKAEECLNTLIGDIVRQLRATETGSADRLRGKALSDLVEPELLREWELFAEHSTIGVLVPDRIKERLERRLRECLEQEVVLGYSDLALSKLNFSIDLPAHAIRPRPNLRIVKSSSPRGGR